MEPIIIAVGVVILIVLVLLLPSAAAPSQVTAQQQSLDEMQQVAGDARRHLKTLSHTYRRQITRVARPRVTPPHRRIP